MKNSLEPILSGDIFFTYVFLERRAVVHEIKSQLSHRILDKTVINTFNSCIFRGQQRKYVDFNIFALKRITYG